MYGAAAMGIHKFMHTVSVNEGASPMKILMAPKSVMKSSFCNIYSEKGNS